MNEGHIGVSDVTVVPLIREDDIFSTGSIIVRAGYVSVFRDLFQIVFSMIFDLRQVLCGIFFFFLLPFLPANSVEMMFPASLRRPRGVIRSRSGWGAKWSFG
ncbi:hypothetical protein [Actinopolyspora mzabensis]|uniref:hypothetical protein n=1 Tax=Actinopolyspora mzabensis TaxID=995066 RepID=UPI00116004AA|nr:hypothetical protein [Actinopolyspora mzabensis]